VSLLNDELFAASGAHETNASKKAGMKKYRSMHQPD
jgi:hypothetical protein